MRVIFSAKTAPTGRQLQRELNSHHSTKILNWGLSSYSDPNAINSGVALSLAANKRQSRIHFKQNNLSAPELLLIPPSAEHFANGVKWVGRPDYHSKGRNLYLCSNLQEVARALRRPIGRRPTHWTKFIIAPHEFRAHVINGRVVKLVEKIGGQGQIRNYKYGWRFLAPTTNKLRRVRELARSAMESIQLDIGAVDILSDDTNVWLLEINTAPSLMDSSLQLYVRHIKENW